MKESKLSPFDGDLLAMIADITKVEPKVTENDNKFIVDVQPELTIPGETMEALGKAVARRLGDRLLGTSENHGVYSFHISYDPEEYPEGKNTENRRRSTYQKKWKQWRHSLLICRPGSEIQIQRVDLKKNPRDKRRAKNQQKNRKGGRNNER